MGGLAKRIPFTWATMLIGNLALTGVGIPLLGIGTAGFYSKDGIINAAFLAPTTDRSLRLLADADRGRADQLLFLAPVPDDLPRPLSRARSQSARHGGGHDDHGHHAPKLEEIHESPLTMLIPLGVLALGALFAGAAFDHVFVGGGRGRLLARCGRGGHRPWRRGREICRCGKSWRRWR